MAAGMLALALAGAGMGRAAAAQTDPVPSITSAGPFEVAEGSLVVAPMVASGFSADAGDLLWSIMSDAGSGADGGVFVLHLDNALAFRAPEDFEIPGDADDDGTYEVTVKVSDGADTDPAEATADIRVTVTDVAFEPFASDTVAVDVDENSPFRVATLEVGDPVVSWSLSGADSTRFSIQGGVLRFVGVPDFEAPADAGTDSVYDVTVTAAEDSADSDTVVVAVTVADVDEPGTVALSTTVPRVGQELTASLSDPDGVVGEAVWVWERSVGRSGWEVIEGRTADRYVPAAADSEDYIRVTATYEDGHGAGNTAQAVASSPPLGKLLESLSVTTSSMRQMYPAFDPQTLHYAVGCDRDVTLSLSADDAGAQLSVNGIQHDSQNAEVTLTGLHDGVGRPYASDILIVVSDAAGASTTYTVHCIDAGFPQVNTRKRPGAAGVTEDLMLMAPSIGASLNRTYLMIVDNNGVPRFHDRLIGVKGGPMFRFFNIDGQYRYAYGVTNSPTVHAHVLLGENFETLARITTRSPLRDTDNHDFLLLDDGNYLLMAYEWANRDFTFLERHGFINTRRGSVVTGTQNVRDSAIQLREPGGRVLQTWNSWDHMEIRDCVHHRFPDGYAHINSFQMIDGRIVASFRGCSKILWIDAGTGEVVARVGQTNQSRREWEHSGLGPAPLTIVGDPYAVFCAQHAAQILPNGNLIMYDNGGPCLWDRDTDIAPRADSVFARGLEYALDFEHGEAIFQRHHALHGDFDGAETAVSALVEDQRAAGAFGDGDLGPVMGGSLSDAPVRRVLLGAADQTPQRLPSQDEVAGVNAGDV